MGGNKMLTDDDSDDESVLPEDVLASNEEIAEAVAHARRDTKAKVRFLVAARFILATTRELKRLCEPEDLFQDAIVAVLAGKRKWRTNRVDFNGLLVGAMRSMASNRDKTLKKNPKLTMEHELPLIGEEQEPQKLEEIAPGGETTEEAVLRREQESLEETQFALLRARYGPDDLHGRILDIVRQGFVSHLEVRQALGIDEGVYRNAWKALMRAAESLNVIGKE
jgi:DNA-directed RNA polymerase specialized sigma24 family protein